MSKTIEEHFRDWHDSVFGYGYGTGEPYTISATKKFLELCNEGGLGHSYDYTKLEAALTAPVAWLMINIFCKPDIDIIEYGTSPRFAWLTKKGERLKEFISKYTEDALLEIVRGDDKHYSHCYPNACNCGENGYEKGKVCQNPFWID